MGSHQSLFEQGSQCSLPNFNPAARSLAVFPVVTSLPFTTAAAAAVGLARTQLPSLCRPFRAFK